jgi:uncharacterized membrane protein (DUF2068 family)
MSVAMHESASGVVEAVKDGEGSLKCAIERDFVVFFHDTVRTGQMWAVHTCLYSERSS